MKLLSVLLLSLLPLFGFSQSYPAQDAPDWVQLMYADDADPGKVSQAYEDYYNEHEFVKNSHTQFYKRWMRELSRQIRPGQADLGRFRSLEEAYVSRALTLKAAENGPNWECVGPFDFDRHASSRSYAPGAAHIYTVKQCLVNDNVLYAGTATAGVWRTIDKGNNWTLLTADMLINRVRAIEISNYDPNIAWFNGGGIVYKTIDGGNSWYETGDSVFKSLYQEITDIVSHPDSDHILYLASDQGFYMSTDSGETWVREMPGIFQEIEFKPNDANTIYAIEQFLNKTYFWKSIDAGRNFTQKQTGWPYPGANDENKRTEIATTPIAPDMLYALATGKVNGGEGLYGIYVSEDAGESWDWRCCGWQEGGLPDSANYNMMAWKDDGSDDGGQYYYDLALEVSDTNAGVIHVAGVNHWVSTDTGHNFTCPAQWSHPQKKEYVHADIHDIRAYGTDTWFACDGGVFYTNSEGDSIWRSMKGIAGTDFWGFGAGFNNWEVMLGGTYHNGTMLKDGDVYENGWLCTQGGDNYRGYVNPGNDRIVYHDGGGKVLPGDRSKDISSFVFNLKPNASYIIGESSNMAWDPREGHRIYFGNENTLYLTEDNGSSAKAVHDFGEKVASVEVAYTDPSRIYVVTYPDWWDPKKLYRSDDGGENWQDVTPHDSVFSYNALWGPFDITVSGTDPDELWLARTPQSSQYYHMDGEKIFKSEDGGASWMNITTSTLDGEYITNIIHQRGTDGGVYLGTRRAAYYRNDTMSDWMLYNNGMPLSTYSVDLNINYREGKIINGTNRSVYASDLFEDSKPIAQLAADKRNIYCLRDTAWFFDHSIVSDSNVTRTWNFPGGTASSTSDERVSVHYTAEGSYDVQLIIKDAFGSDTMNIEDFITVVHECDADTVPGLALHSDQEREYLSIPPLDTRTNELSMSCWIRPQGVQKKFTGILMHSSVGAGLNFRANMELAYHWPGGSWSWSSGDTVPANEWSHVAIVVRPDSVTLYLNGNPTAHVTATDSVTFDRPIYAGSYHNWKNRSYFGMIDEVCIWDRALTTNEIRDQMHLTKNPPQDSSLIRYYQFNREEWAVTDRVGDAHANPINGATRIRSTAPIGGGVSYRTTVSGSGKHVMGNTGLELQFPAFGPYPEGEIVVNRINVAPDEGPQCDASFDDRYWIINQYGGNETFTRLDSLHFMRVNVPGLASLFKDHFYLYERPFNADSTTWGNYLDSSGRIKIGRKGSIHFGPSSRVTNFGQLVIGTKGLYYDSLRMCEGDTILVAGQPRWNPGNYIDTLDSGSCDSVIVTQLHMDIKPVKPVIIEDKGRLYTTIPGSSYQWYRNGVKMDGETNQSLIKAITAFYQVEVISGACTSEISNQYHFFVGLHPIGSEAFQVYPNPAKNLLNVISQEDTRIRIMDISGRIILDDQLNDRRNQIDISKLSSGMYFIKLKSKSQEHFTKIVIQNN